MKVTSKEIYEWLEEVKDPEIPVLSLVDLGVITSVEIIEDKVIIDMTPTFVGCPAIDFMKSEVEDTLKKQGIINVIVNLSFRIPWSSDRISEKGKLALKEFGLAPPSQSQLISDLEILSTATCPRCAGTNTELKNPFGPTLCRSIHYCYDCKEAFEQFKSI